MSQYPIDTDEHHNKICRTKLSYKKKRKTMSPMLHGQQEISSLAQNLRTKRKNFPHL